MNPTVIEALDKIGWPEWHFDTNWGVYRERLRKAKVGWAIDRFYLDFGKRWKHHTKLAEAVAIALIEKHLREWLEKRGIWVGLFADYLHALASAVLAAVLPKLQQEVTDARNSIQS